MKRIFVAYCHGVGTSSLGYGCAMLEVPQNNGISSFGDLSTISTLIKNSNPALKNSTVVVTLFRVLPEIATDTVVSWMVAYVDGIANANAIGVGMFVIDITGPPDLDLIIQMIKRDGKVNPTVTNLQPLKVLSQK